LDIFNVELSLSVKKQLRKTPSHIINKLFSWVEGVEKDGLNYMRKIPGYHDERLKGKREGERSIRLSKAYRAIYIIDRDTKIQFIEVTEVNKHEY
jgi:proteic killer suppression protein